MTQPRTDTATLIKSCQLIWLHLQSDDGVANSALREIADLLEEQEEAFRNLEISFGKMTEMAVKDGDTIREQEATIRALRSELVELSAKAMSQEDTIRHLRTELCNASAEAMEHAEAVRTFREEIDLLNSRPKR
jgi:predicted RNase H-like nuclease (RuvC/YqgF family)